jgi:hypothetical protein
MLEAKMAATSTNFRFVGGQNVPVAVAAEG